MLYAFWVIAWLDTNSPLYPSILPVLLLAFRRFSLLFRRRFLFVYFFNLLSVSNWPVKRPDPMSDSNSLVDIARRYRFISLPCPPFCFLFFFFTIRSFGMAFGWMRRDGTGRSGSERQLETTRLHGRMKNSSSPSSSTCWNSSPSELYRARMFCGCRRISSSFFFSILKTQSTTARFLNFVVVVVIATNRKEQTLSFPPVFIDSRVGHFFFGIGWIRRHWSNFFLADRLFLDR